MRKTKIICTLGPSTDKEGVLRELIANGMNVARFNFSHGSHEEHLGRFEKLKALREELGKPVGSDADNDKTTFITLYGLQGAHEEAERHNTAALAALDALGPGADFLRQMAAELLERKK